MSTTRQTRRDFLKLAGATSLTAAIMPTAAAAEPSEVTAFDIDGALTRQPVRDNYFQRRRDGEKIGIVTARTDEGAADFIAEHDLEPSFVRTTPVKWPALNDLEQKYGSGPTYTYVGSWLRDWVAATVAGWQYVDGGDVQ